MLSCYRSDTIDSIIYAQAPRRRDELVRFVRRRFSSDADADDVVQQALPKATQATPAARDARSLPAWFCVLRGRQDLVARGVAAMFAWLALGVRGRAARRGLAGGHGAWV